MRYLLKILTILCLVGCATKPPATTKPLNFTVKTFRTYPQSYLSDLPQYLLFTEVSQLEDFLSKDGFVVSGAENSPEINDYFKKYNKEYFKNNSLVLLLLLEPSGSIKHQIDTIKLQEKTLHINLIKRVPKIGTMDMANWSIFIELDQRLEAGIELEINTTSTPIK